jgi:uncharacterized protein YkwD
MRDFMPFPLLLAASVLIPTRHLPRVSVKDDVQFVMITSPLKFSHPKPYRQMMPLRAVLRLEEYAVEAREETVLIAAINQERLRQGLRALMPDSVLTETARTHCLEMCRLDYFEHQSPVAGQHTPMERYLSSCQRDGGAEPQAVLVGENIFYCSVSSATYNANYAHQSLMASPGHRANILNPEFSKVGVGLYRDIQGHFWVTEMFLRDTE